MAVRLPPRLSHFFVTAARAQSTAATLSVTAGSRGGTSRAMSSPPPSYTTLKDRATCEREIKKSKFIAVAAPIADERSAHSFLEEVRDPRATHNCWAYKLGDQYRSNDDGEPSGTAGKPIYSAIVSSGIDMVMVVVIRYFGGIKLGTGGLVRAYGGVALECIKDAATCFVKPKAPVGILVPFELLGSIYHQMGKLICKQWGSNRRHTLEMPYKTLATGPRLLGYVELQHFQAEDIKQDYDTGEDGVTMVTFKIDYDRIDSLEDAVNSACSRKLEFFKH